MPVTRKCGPASCRNPSVIVRTAFFGFVKTDFAESMTNPEVKAKIAEQAAQMAIPPEARARARVFDRAARRCRRRRHRRSPHRAELKTSLRSVVENGTSAGPQRRAAVPWDGQ